MTHAIDRITERVFDRLGNSFGSYSQVFGILAGLNPNIGKVIDGDKGLVSFYIRSTLNLENAQLWKVGYGSCIFDKSWAGVKTILAPGMKRTPENRTLWKLKQQGVPEEDLERIQESPTMFSLWCWLNGHADSLITKEGTPVQPPRINIGPKEFYEKTKDKKAFLEALDDWGIGYVAKHMKGREK